MTHAPLIVAAPSEAERLCVRGFDALHELGPRYQRGRFAGRPVLVTPRGASERYDVASLLSAEPCDVRRLADGFDADRSDPLTHASSPMYDDADPEAAQAGKPALPWLPLAELARTPAPPPQWAVEGWIPAAGATLLSGHGGSGKTALAAQITLCLASGADFLGLPVKRQRVALVLAETSRGILLYRMQRAAHALGVDFDRIEAEGWLRVLLADEVPGGLALFGREAQLGEGGRAWLPPTATETVGYKLLRADLRRSGTTALVLDPAADFFDAEEINRRDVRGFIACLRTLVSGPALLSAHVNRESVKTPKAGQAWSGSTAWHNSVRARLELTQPRPLGDDEPTPDDGTRLLHLAKNNDGRTGMQIEARLCFERWVFEPTVPTTTEGGMVDSIRRRTDSEWLVRFIAEAAERGDPVHASRQANRNPHARINAREDCPTRYRGKQAARALYAELDRLREAGTIKPGERRNAGRNVVEVLLPGDAYAS